MTQPTAAGSGGRTWRDLWSHARSSLGDEMTARRLVEEVSGLDGLELMLRADEPATGAATSRMRSAVARLQAGEPLQHVLGHWGFRDLDLAVGPGALIPRPETEIVVEVALAELRRVQPCARA